MIPVRLPGGKPKRKYRNEPIAVDGIKFASKKEAARYGTLWTLQKAGEIRNLNCHPAYDLHAPCGTKVGRYIADFEYSVCSTGEIVVEDVKSPVTAATRAFQQKKRHFETEYRRRLRVIM